MRDLRRAASPLLRTLLLLLTTGGLLLAPAMVCAAGQESQTVAIDSTRALRPAGAAAPLRPPNPARYAALRARGDLQYHPPNYQPARTWWERFWSWFWDVVNDIFGSKAAGQTYAWLWYAFLLGATAWVVLRVLKLDIGSIFRRAPRAAPAYDVALAESPFTDDLAARLAEAEVRGDYRLAVRLGYLTALRQLADRELIRWLPDKTNQQYLRELPAGPLRDAFAPLTRQFELAWYGELIPTAPEYAAARESRAVLTRALQPVSAPAA
ncbi:MAG: DUF4129 domain-containing protein [Hymenobacteraceae bacterium]|nr:DUF4129 domain-containing protein [Hymenobacteraceae bacterium]